MHLYFLKQFLLLGGFFIGEVGVRCKMVHLVLGLFLVLLLSGECFVFEFLISCYVMLFFSAMLVLLFHDCYCFA